MAFKQKIEHDFVRLARGPASPPLSGLRPQFRLCRRAFFAPVLSRCPQDGNRTLHSMVRLDHLAPEQSQVNFVPLVAVAGQWVKPDFHRYLLGFEEKQVALP